MRPIPKEHRGAGSNRIIACVGSCRKLHAEARIERIPESLSGRTLINRAASIYGNHQTGSSARHRQDRCSIVC